VVRPDSGNLPENSGISISNGPHGVFFEILDQRQCLLRLDQIFPNLPGEATRLGDDRPAGANHLGTHAH